MATPTEKLKSSGDLTEQNIFLKQKKHFGKRSVLFGDEFSTPTSLQRLRAIQLQQYLELLKERERRAQQRNRQLLQQFEEAQSALDEMLACNAAMKTIRMEYEGYLEESAPRWLQQFKEKTAAVQKEQRVEKHFKSRQEEAEYPVPNLTADDSFPSQDAQKTVAPQGWSTPECRNNQDGRPHPFTQYSWLTHPQIQSSMFPLRGSNPPQTLALLSPPTIPHPLLVHPLASSPCPLPQHGYPWLAGTSLGSHGYKEEPHPELRGFQNGENSKRRRGGSRSSQLSPELDIKPVRLSGRHSESSGSSRGPTLSTKEKRKKRGRVELSGSDVNSEETSSASVAESQLLEDPSSVKGSFRETQRSEGLIAASPRPDEEERTEKRSERLNERNQRSEEESGSSTKGSMQAKQGQRSHSDESERSRQGESEEEEQQGSESCERRNTEEEIQTKLSSREEEKRQKSQKDRSVEEDDCSMKTTTEEEAGTAAEEEDEEAAGTAAEEEDEESAGTAAEEEDEEAAGTAAEEEDEEAAGTAAEEEDEEAGTAAEEEDEEAGTAAEEEDEEAAGTAAEKDLNEEQPNHLKEVDDEKIKDSSSSQEEDEEEMESSEKTSEEESRRDGGKTDSDDSIISPQNKSYKEKKIQLVLVMPAEESVLQSSAQTIPETAAEEEEENTGSSNENAVESSDGDDVENVLAPQDRKQKDVSHLDLFQVTEDRQKTELQGDSDEFDPFYD